MTVSNTLTIAVSNSTSHTDGGTDWATSTDLSTDSPTATITTTVQETDTSNDQYGDESSGSVTLVSGVTVTALSASGSDTLSHHEQDNDSASPTGGSSDSSTLDTTVTTQYSDQSLTTSSNSGGVTSATVTVSHSNGEVDTSVSSSTGYDTSQVPTDTGTETVTETPTSGETYSDTTSDTSLEVTTNDNGAISATQATTSDEHGSKRRPRPSRGIHVQRPFREHEHLRRDRRLQRVRREFKRLDATRCVEYKHGPERVTQQQRPVDQRQDGHLERQPAGLGGRWHGRWNNPERHDQSDRGRHLLYLYGHDRCPEHWDAIQSRD